MNDCPSPLVTYQWFLLDFQPSQEEMTQLRKRNFKLFGRCFSHMNFGRGILLLYQLWATPGLDSATWAACCLVFYMLFTAVAQDYVELTRSADLDVMHEVAPGRTRSHQATLLSRG